MIPIRGNETKGPGLTTDRRWLSFSVVAIASLMLILSACRSINSRVRGSVEAEQRGDQLVVEYDILMDLHDLDSVALQVLAPENDRYIHFPSEARVMDSLYQLYEEDCCFDLHIRDFLLPDSIVVNLREELGTEVCWWSPRLLPDRRDSSGLETRFNWWTHIDSVLALGDLDSLRSISIPCSWEGGGPGSAQLSVIDTGFQHDSVIFRAESSQTSPEFQRFQESHSDHAKFSGTLHYRLPASDIPRTYCLKFYEPVGDSWKARSSSVFWRLDPAAVVWRGVIPDRPDIERFNFEDRGHMIGMFMGLGACESDRRHLPSVLADENSKTLFALDIGLSYYSSRTLIELGGGFSGYSQPDDTTDAYQLSYASLPSVRWYPFTRTSVGPIVKGGLVSANLEVRDRPSEFERGSWGVMAGLGYETDFDRLEYSYVTALDGYHQIDLLLGINAIRHGKEGLRLVLRHGKTVKFASVQLYMGNRVLWRTISPHNPRSKLVTALLWIGATAAWSAIY